MAEALVHDQAHAALPFASSALTHHHTDTPRYDKAAATEAWRHTLDWFNKYLRA